MNYQPWEWNCSACGEVFRGATAARAETQFQTHARDAHNAKVVLSFNGEEES